MRWAGEESRCVMLGERCRRCVEGAVALGGLVALSPALVGIGVAVRLDSRGPALFHQRRVGRYGSEFWLHKFRTMRVDLEAAQGRFEPGGSPRVTRVGRWLRRTKLDELPQLWNVVVGEMAFVGPRPEVRRWVEVYPEVWARVLRVRPGLTDPAAIVFRDEEELLARAEDPERAYREEVLPEKLRRYEDYLRVRSWRTDVGVVWDTLRALRRPRRG